jgi:hypothetical protein
MKGSDSTNSLTELTAVKQDDSSCFICLEEETLGFPLISSKILRNCGCRFYVHADCWNVWIKNKTDYDCPICHRASMLKIHIPPNPVLTMDLPPPTRNIRIQRLLCVFTILFIFGVSSIIIERIINS